MFSSRLLSLKATCQEMKMGTTCAEQIFQCRLRGNKSQIGNKSSISALLPSYMIRWSTLSLHWCCTYICICNGKLKFSLSGHLQSWCSMVLWCKSDSCSAQFTGAHYLTWHQLQWVHYKLHQATSIKKKKERLSQRLASKQPADNANIKVSDFIKSKL